MCVCVYISVYTYTTKKFLKRAIVILIYWNSLNSQTDKKNLYVATYGAQTLNLLICKAHWKDVLKIGHSVKGKYRQYPF